MEFKTIIYLIAAIAYAVYSFRNKSKEVTGKTNLPGKRAGTPQTANTGKTVDEILREMQAEINKQNRQTKPAASKPSKSQKLLVEAKANSNKFEEGRTKYGNVYERELTFEEKLHSTSSTETTSIDLMGTEETHTYEFNPREAFIGSLIFERKF